MGKTFTWEDAKMCFNLFCCVYGIGTLGMPGNFARSGPVIATLALIAMAVANVYASVMCSRVLLLAPSSVRTFGDLGRWCMGRTGHLLVMISQMGVCLLVPIAFLILGGILLDGLFPGSFSPTTWIVLMAFSALPVCLTPTLKEGALAAFAGCLGTVIADIIGVGVLLHGMRGHPAIPAPDISFEQVATVFGNLSLAYGAGVVIPTLQRQHSDPTRMPRIIGVTLTFVSVLFLILSGTAYSAVGCQIPGNLLFAIVNSAKTGLTKLGFSSDRGMVVLAYLAMQLHITIAFSVILHPVFYILERLLLGMHRPLATDAEAANYVANQTPTPQGEQPKAISARHSSFASMADIEKVHDDDELEALEYQNKFLRASLLRCALIAIQVVVAIAFREKFMDVVDFTGASCISLSCIILPLVFAMYKMGDRMKAWEKVLSIAIILVCVVIGSYVTYTSGRNLFAPTSSDIEWPFCKPEFRHELYYNTTAVHELHSAARFL